MENLNSNLWKTFLVKDLFVTKKQGKRIQVPTGASVDRSKLIVDGKIPRITVTNANNGIYGYYDCDEKEKNYRVYENFISVSFLGTVFYQPKKASLDMKVHCLKPLDFSLNENIAHFLVTVIRKAIEERDYIDQLSSTVLPELEINLPIDINGKLDIQYMENSVKRIRRKCKNSYKNLKNVAETNSKKLDTTKWKKFQIEELFDVKKGSRLTKADMKDGNRRYIGASSFNNGITAYISNSEHIHSGNTLTVCYNGSDIGRTFYQKEEFWATDDVNVLYPKFAMTENIALFIAPMIKYAGGQHEYTDKWQIEDMKKDYILLPINDDGTPDFIFMGKYITDMKKKCKMKLRRYQMI